MSTLHGSWIWYDLMTPDPEGAKAFYEAVVGWSMTTGHVQPTATMASSPHRTERWSAGSCD